MSTPTPTTPKTYKFHRLANIFPLLDENSPAFKAFVEDIEKRGQQELAWLYEGEILEGRNRQRACQRLGLEVKTRAYLGDDPIGFVLSANLHRRHLNEGQRAMVGAELTNLEKGANQYTKGGVSTEAAAKMLSVGRASIERARVVLKNGDPALIEEVKQGEKSVTAAANEAVAPAAAPETTTQEEKTEEQKASEAAIKLSARVDRLGDNLVEALKKMRAETAKAAAANIVRQLQAADFLEKGKKAA